MDYYLSETRVPKETQKNVFIILSPIKVAMFYNFTVVMISLGRIPR